MAVRIICVFVVALALSVLAGDSIGNTGVQLAIKVFEECSSKHEGFSPCLKKKAIVFLDRLGRMKNVAINDELLIVKSDSNATTIVTPALTEDQLEVELPRAEDARDGALNNLLYDKAISYISSRTFEVTMPKVTSVDLGIGEEEGRRKRMKGMMGGMMMGMAGKMMMLIPLGIAGLFLLAGKALITAKVALLIAGIIAIKKLAASRNSGGGGGHGAQQVWASPGGGGGGWDRRSLNLAHQLAYKSYSPQQ